jgi:amidase
VPLGPEYADPLAAMAVEHVVTRTVRDSATVLDAVAGPDTGEPFPAPARPGTFADEVGRPPGRLRIAFSATAADGYPTDPTCVAALEDAVRLCEALGHEVIERWLPELREPVGAAIGTFYGGAVDWIISYWIRRLGREPEPGELEPLTVAFWEQGRTVSAGQYLLAVEELRRYAREVARFFLDHDLWLTPTLAEPPPLLGEMASRDDDPLAGLRRSSRFVAFPGIVANITGGAAMSLPLWWSDDGLPVGVHFLGRPGDEPRLLRLAAQLEEARSWADRRPSLT